MSEEKKEDYEKTSAAQRQENYNNLLEGVRKAYKPMLKVKSKNELIKIIVDLATQVTLYKEQLKKDNSNE